MVAAIIVKTSEVPVPYMQVVIIVDTFEKQSFDIFTGTCCVQLASGQILER